MINTILEVQPRSSSGGEGKSNDEIVQELVASVRTRVPGSKQLLAYVGNGTFRNKLRKLSDRQVSKSAYVEFFLYVERELFQCRGLYL